MSSSPRGASLLRLSWHALRREWRAGELRVLAAALVVGVASVTSVAFFTDRIARLMEGQAGELLGADLVVSSARALPGAWREQAPTLGLESTETLSFASVATSGERLQLAEVKAVEPGYPLRGRLRIAAAAYAADTPTTDIPAPGSAWVEPRLLAALALSVGDQIGVGATELRVAAALSFEPDRGAGLINIAPRLLMNRADIPATRVLQPGSRVEYRLLVAGPEARLQRYRTWLEPQLASGQRLQSPREARPELRAALDRGGHFLNLAALVSLVLSGVAIATAARRYAGRHFDTSAVLRCLGATQALILRLFGLQLLWLGLAASLLGCLLGYVAQAGLGRFLGGLVADALPPPSLAPVVPGMLAGLITLLGFGLPPLLRLKKVPPARVLRHELGPPPASNRLLYGLALATIAALMLWQTRDATLTVLVMLGALGSVTLLWMLALGLVWLTGLLRGRVGVAWRFGLANIARRARGSVVQVLAFGLGIMVMLLLTLVRGDLLAGWRETLPPQAPNHFLINIQPDQVAALRSFLEARGLPDPGLYPMVRGRLVRINDRPVSPADYAEPRAQRLVDREFNLSWAERPAADNRVVAGHWWRSADGPAVASVEQGLADTLGIHLGDTLAFRIGDQTVTTRVSNLRSVDWDSFRVNFFVLFPPGVLDSYPATYITSFHLDRGEQGLLRDLVARFPSVTVIDVDAVMRQVRSIIDRVTLAVEYVFGFTLIAGLVVLYAAIQATQDERVYEGAVLRTLGARRRQLLLGLASEFGTIGLLAGTLAAAAATVVALLLAGQVFHLGYRPDPWVWIGGVLGGGLGVGAAGLLGTRSVLRQPPLQVLRRR